MKRKSKFIYLVLHMPWLIHLTASLHVPCRRVLPEKCFINSINFCKVIHVLHKKVNYHPITQVCLQTGKCVYKWNEMTTDVGTDKSQEKPDKLINNQLIRVLHIGPRIAKRATWSVSDSSFSQLSSFANLLWWSLLDNNNKIQLTQLVYEATQEIWKHSFISMVFFLLGLLSTLISVTNNLKPGGIWKRQPFVFCRNGFNILKIKLFKNGIVMTIMWFLRPNFPQTQFYATMTSDCCIGLKISQIKSWEKRHD